MLLSFAASEVLAFSSKLSKKDAEKQSRLQFRGGLVYTDADS